MGSNSSNGITYHLAEVLNNTFERIDTGDEKDNSDNLYLIEVEIYSAEVGTSKVTAKPASLNNTMVPGKGEHILVYLGYSSDNNGISSREQWYYLPIPIAMNSGINNNFNPGISAINNEPDARITDVNISPLQLYSGDYALQGRWGNTIRLGSTIQDDGSYTESPNWIGNDPDPIIILSNTKRNLPLKGFVVENVNEDWSSLWLTSTQQIPTLKINSWYNDPSNYNSQFIGVGDRIVLQSKKDIIALHGETAIEILVPNTDQLGGGIRIGTPDTKKEGILYSGEVYNALRKIIDIIDTLKVGALAVTSNVEYIEELRDIINGMTNDNIRIDRKG